MTDPEPPKDPSAKTDRNPQTRTAGASDDQSASDGTRQRKVWTPATGRVHRPPKPEDTPLEAEGTVRTEQRGTEKAAALVADASAGTAPSPAVPKTVRADGTEPTTPARPNASAAREATASTAKPATVRPPTVPAPPAPKPEEPPAKRWGAGSYIRFGLLWVAILGGGLGTWSATAQLSGAVIATGQMRVQTNRQVVQHPDGGVVGEILARDGDLVAAGEILIRLDDTLLRSELMTLESQLYEIIARRGRLEAVQSGAETIDFDAELLAAADVSEDVRSLISGQQDLFTAQRRAFDKEVEVLGERKVQFSEQIVGVEAQIEAMKRQLELIAQELVGMYRLLDQGLMQESRVLALEREAARLEGQRGQLISQVAQLRGQISQIDIEIVRMDANQIREAISESRELGFRELELKERRLALREQLSRLDIRAPRPGTVLDSTVHAIQSVVRPAEPILYVIPSDSELVVDARVDPINIDQVFRGQDTVLRLSALNTRTTPELFGTVSTVAADIVVDEQSGLQYYKTEVALNDDELTKLDGQELVAGMPVEVYIQTGERTPLNYLLKPITDYFNKALREE